MKPPARLRSALADIDHALTHWHAFHRDLADRTPDGYPPGGDSGPRSHDVPDPTCNTVTARINPTRTWTEATTLVERIAADSRRLAIITSSIGEAPAPDGSLRCTGAPDQPWGDPTCTTNAVRAGLCWACIKRRQRYEDEYGQGRMT